MNIKEAAEACYPHAIGTQRGDYISIVTHYLDYWKSQGYAMLKVGGDAEDIANNIADDEWMSEFWKQDLKGAISKALTIGEERGRRFAEWAEANCAQKFEGTWVSVLMFQGTKTTSELWEIAEMEGIFNDKNK